jgi:hypothetical protein
VNSTKQKIARKKRIAQVSLNADCLVHLEIISCEKEINKLIELLTKHCCVKQIFVNKKVDNT